MSEPEKSMMWERQMLDRLLELPGLLLRRALRKAVGWVSTESLLENTKPGEERKPPADNTAAL